MGKKGTSTLQEYFDDLLLNDVPDAAQPEQQVPEHAPAPAKPLSPESLTEQSSTEQSSTEQSSTEQPSTELPATRQPPLRSQLQPLPGLSSDSTAPDSARLVAATPAPQLEASRPRPQYASEELVALEQSKREKLQALLNTKPVVAPPDHTVSTPPIELVVSAPAVLEAASTPAPETQTLEPKASTAVMPELQQSEVRVVEEQVAVPETMVDDGQPSTANSEATVNAFLAWHENGRPHWAQNRFDALLFDVAGLKLAVPLIALGQIQSLTDELTPIFGQADWFMGLMPTPAGKIRTINTALFVMPEKYDPSFKDTAKYVVSIDGLPWGLAVDGINQPISLDPDDVKWRTERSKRPWLAGTVKSAMCALIDIPQMGKMLTDADKNHRGTTKAR